MSVEADIQKILKIKKEIYSAILCRGIPPYSSTLYGKIVDDDSEWVGNSSVVSKKFRIKISVTTLVKAIQVKFKYGWPDLVGYVHFDTNIKSVEIL